MLTRKILFLILANGLLAALSCPGQGGRATSSAPGAAVPSSAQKAVPLLAAPGAGVPFTLARQRKALLDDIRYGLNFHIPASKTDPVTGEERLSFILRAPGLSGSVLALDFKGAPGAIHSVAVNGKSIPGILRNEHLLLPAALLNTGLNEVRIVFQPGDAPLNRNADFLYTLLVPDRARTLFPCFDQPDLKAVFTLTLTAPRDWKVMGNGSIKDSVPIGDSCLWHFQPSDRISTYLFSFVTGKFAEADAAPDGRPMRFLYRETDNTKLRLSLDSIFRIEGQALKFMDDYTGIAYPFQKFDFVAIPDFQFGGMEHAGAIQYKASSLFLDSGATKEQFIGRSNLLSHETAHMWFGDLVTMSWFNDVWMKEVFANFMADKISSVTLPDDNYDLKFLTDHYPAAYTIDRTMGTHPIRQQLDNLNDAGSLYGNIIYHKAPIMMRQLERLMGADAFRDGLRDYLKEHAGGNAPWPDLIHNLQAHTKENLAAWNQVWVNEAGRPRFSYTLTTRDDRITDLAIYQEGEDGSKRVWPQVFTLALLYKDRVEELTVNSKTRVVHLTEAIGKGKPEDILFNSNGLGYGVFPVDTSAWVHFGLRKVPLGRSPLMRAAEYINLYENMLDGKVLKPWQVLSYCLGRLGSESSEQVLNILLDQLQSVFWRYTSPARRDSIGPMVEQTCRAAIQSVGSVNEKKLLFRTFSNIVTTRPGLDSLYAVWKDRRPPAGVVLSEEDYTNLAAALALRAYPGYAAILQEQLSRIHNEDRRQRLEYLLPALSDDSAVRDRYFATLQSAAARRKEAWVLTALGYLFHPLRTAVSEKYLPASLDWLEDIQRTGDVFFPQSWLQATVGGCRSRSAAVLVRHFLLEHPNYNPKLKAKILQAADPLFRAGKLVK